MMPSSVRKLPQLTAAQRLDSASDGFPKRCVRTHSIYYVDAATADFIADRARIHSIISTIHPKPVRAVSDEPEVPAIFGGNQLDVWIRLHSLRFENSEWDERIILSLDEQHGDANGVEVPRGRLGPVIVRRVAEAERRSGDPVVDLRYRGQAREVAPVYRPVSSRRAAMRLTKRRS